jgi:hypothetical protein
MSVVQESINAVTYFHGENYEKPVLSGEHGYAAMQTSQGSSLAPEGVMLCTQY